MNDMTTPSIDATVLVGSLFVLTGPTRGLGRALYDVLRARDVPMVALGRGIDRLTGGSNDVLIEADFADPLPAHWLDALKLRLHRLLDEYPGRPVVFINNAGTVAPICPATHIEDGALQLAMQVNFAAPCALARTIAELAIAQGRRLRIVNVTTGAAQRPIAGWLAYCASKAACRMAFDVLVAENPGIELVHVDPGVVDTGMQAYIRDQGPPGAAAIATALKPADQAAAEVLAKGLEGRP